MRGRFLSTLKSKYVLYLLFIFVIFFNLINVKTLATEVDNIEWTLHYGGDCGKSSQSVKWQYHTHNQSASDRYHNNRFTLTAGYGQDSGVMENYVYKNYDFYSQFASSGTRKWNSLASSIYMINIEEGMKVIGDHAFNFCIYAHGISPTIIPYAEDTSSNVHYISLPSTLEEIGFLGFAGALKYVDTLTIPANLSTLDYGSFCSNGFKIVVIEEGNLTTIPSYCFANCTSLEEIYIPKTVKNIDSSAFMGCTSLKKIHYGGYSEDWENVTISGDNDALLSAQVMFPIRVHVSSVTLNTTSKTLLAGNTYTLIATVLPSNADITAIEWNSSNTDVARVSPNGVVTAISAGTAVISATSVEGKITARCFVAVQASTVSVTGITLDSSDIHLWTGDESLLQATVYPSNATNKNVIWSSSNTSVATVDNSGKITAKAKGQTTITVTTIDGNKQAICNVNVHYGATVNKFEIWETNYGSQTLTQSEDYYKRHLLDVSWTPVIYRRDSYDDYDICSVVTFEIVSNTGETYVASCAPYKSIYGGGYDQLQYSVPAGKVYTIVATLELGYYKNYSFVKVDSYKSNTITLDLENCSYYKTSFEDDFIAEEANCSSPAKYYANCQYCGVNYDKLISHGEVNEDNHSFCSWSSFDEKYHIRTCKYCRAVEKEEHQFVADVCVNCQLSNSITTVTSITLNKTNATLALGENVTLTATVSPDNATNKAVTWTTSNASVATVADGVVTAVGAGEAVITAKTADGGKTAICNITVIDPDAPCDVTVYTDAQKFTILQGAEFTFTLAISGTYDGYSFDIPKNYAEGLSVIEVQAADGSDVTEFDDRYMVSVLGGKDREDADKITVATVTVKADENAEVGERELILSNIKISDNTGSKVTAVKYEYACVNITDMLPGDVNEDGVFDYYDVAKLYAYYRAKTTIADYVDTDINSDGGFDYYDVARLYAIYRGKATFE